jgi:hypothetical protein
MWINAPDDGYYPSPEGIEMPAYGHLTLRLPRINRPIPRPWITVEMSEDGGETWQEYSVINDEHWRRGTVNYPLRTNPQGTVVENGRVYDAVGGTWRPVDAPELVPSGPRRFRVWIVAVAVASEGGTSFWLGHTQ